MFPTQIILTWLFIDQNSRKIAACSGKSRKQQQSWLYTNQSLSLKKITGGINGGLINHTTVKYLEFKRDFLFPVSLLLHNTRPVGPQVH